MHQTSKPHSLTSKQVCVIEVVVQQVEVFPPVKPWGLGDHFMVGTPEVTRET
jgi:hypothetical protein